MKKKLDNGEFRERDSLGNLRWGGRVLLWVYIACLIYFMFFSETYGRTLEHRDYQYNLILFREIRRFIKYRHLLGMGAVLINVVGNVAVFIPLGWSVPFLYQRVKSFWQILILSFGISLLAETMQLILKVGCFDVDDLLLNTLGGCMGYGIYLICRWWRTGNGKKRI